jgi:hypothetical protein
MCCQAGFDPWRTPLMPPLAPLSTPHATGVALWRCGLVLARSWALSAGRHWLATGMTRPAQPVRQPRRAWYDHGPRQRGPQRHAWQVEPGGPVWRAGGVRGWPGTPRALAREATARGPRVVVLAVRGG